jgi:hypothetical protein
MAWLAKATREFSPQPYEHLARQFSMAGEEDRARRIRLEAQRRSHAAGGPARRLSGIIQDVVIGYGYAPWRAAVWVFLLLAAGTLYFQARAGTCLYDGRVRPGLCPASSSHPACSPFLYTLDLLLPILSFGQDNAWRGSGLNEAVAVMVMLLGWVLVTTIVAAFARILKRS